MKRLNQAFVFCVLALALGVAQTVAQHVNASGVWDHLGQGGISDSYAEYQSLAMAPNGTLFVAYRDGSQNDKATVLKWENAAWVSVGTKGFSATPASYLSLAVSPTNVPYLAFKSYSSIVVYAHDGAAWSQIGSNLDSAGGNYPCLAFGPNGTPYVAFQENGLGGRFTVKKYTGTNWAKVGSPGFGEALSYMAPSLAFTNGGVPYVAGVVTSPSNRIAVYSFTGNSWNEITTPFSGNYKFPVLKTDGSNTIYLAFGDATSGLKASVYSYSASAWTLLGTAGLTNYAVNNLDLAISSNGYPTIAFNQGNSNQFGAMRYTGSQWEDISPPYSNEYLLTNYVRLVLNSSGTPIAAYKAGYFSNKTAVVTYVDNVGFIEQMKFSMAVYPNPATTEVVVKFNANSPTEIPWKLINSFGQTVHQGIWEGDDLQHSVLLDGLPTGLYWLECVYNADVLRETIVKIE
jgi:hypothetical protein